MENSNSEIKNTNFENCIIHDDCYIINNNLIRNTEIMNKVNIIGCGIIDYDSIIIVI